MKRQTSDSPQAPDDQAPVTPAQPKPSSKIRPLTDDERRKLDAKFQEIRKRDPNVYPLF